MYFLLYLRVQICSDFIHLCCLKSHSSIDFQVTWHQTEKWCFAAHRFKVSSPFFHLWPHTASLMDAVRSVFECVCRCCNHTQPWRLRFLEYTCMSVQQGKERNRWRSTNPRHSGSFSVMDECSLQFAYLYVDHIIETSKESDGGQNPQSFCAKTNSSVYL